MSVAFQKDSNLFQNSKFYQNVFLPMKQIPVGGCQHVHGHVVLSFSKGTNLVAYPNRERRIPNRADSLQSTSHFPNGTDCIGQGPSGLNPSRLNPSHFLERQTHHHDASPTSRSSDTSGTLPPFSSRSPTQDGPTRHSDHPILLSRFQGQRGSSQTTPRTTNLASTLVHTLVGPSAHLQQQQQQPPWHHYPQQSSASFTETQESLDWTLLDSPLYSCCCCHGSVGSNRTPKPHSLHCNSPQQHVVLHGKNHCE